MSDAIEFSLIGANKGKTKLFFGTHFVNGVAMVPNKGEAAATVQRVLREDFGAMPTAEAITQGLLPDPVAEAEKQAQADAKKLADAAKQTEKKPAKTADDEETDEDEDSDEDDTDDKDTELLGDTKTTKAKRKRAR